MRRIAALLGRRPRRSARVAAVLLLAAVALGGVVHVALPAFVLGISPNSSTVAVEAPSSVAAGAGPAGQDWVHSTTSHPEPPMEAVWSPACVFGVAAALMVAVVLVAPQPSSASILDLYGKSGYSDQEGIVTEDMLAAREAKEKRFRQIRQSVLVNLKQADSGNSESSKAKGLFAKFLDQSKAESVKQAKQAESREKTLENAEEGAKQRVRQKQAEIEKDKKAEELLKKLDDDRRAAEATKEAKAERLKKIREGVLEDLSKKGSTASAESDAPKAQGLFAKFFQQQEEKEQKSEARFQKEVQIRQGAVADLVKKREAATKAANEAEAAAKKIEELAKQARAAAEAAKRLAEAA